MTGGINNTQSSSITHASITDTNIDTSSSKNSTVTTKSSFTTIQDSTSTADGGDGSTKAYNNSSGKPALYPPKDNGTSNAADEALLQQLFNPTQFIEFLKSSDVGPSPLTEQQKEEFDKIQVDDPEIIALAAKLGISPGEAQEKLQVSSSIYFEEAIKDLPEEQQNQLKFARNNPEGASSLSPELKTLLAKINQNITSSMIADLKGLGISASWGGVQPDSEVFNANMTGEFDASFENKLFKMTLGEQITPEQGLKLKTMHFMPGSFANDPTLQALFAKVEASAVADIQAKYGTDKTWTPTADTNYFSQIANGFFCQNFQSQLSAYQPPLTSDQQKEIMNLFADPTLPPSSPEIGKIASSIKATSIEATINQFGLEKTWAPTVTSITSADVDTSRLAMGKSAFDTATLLYNKLNDMVNSLPDGPIKAAYINYLQAISVALNKLQDQLYALASTDSKTSRDLSKANMDASLANIKSSRAAAQEAQAKQADTKTLNLPTWMNDINAWIGNIVSLAVSCCVAFAVGCFYGPAAAALILTVAVFDFVDKAMVAAGNPSIIGGLAKELNEVLGDFAPLLTGPLAIVLSGGNPMLAMSFMSQAKTIQLTIKAAGGDKMAQEIGAAVFNGIVQIGAMVVMMILSGGAQAPAIFGMITAKIAQITTLSVSTVNKILFAINLTFTVALGALQATQQGLQCKWEMVQADIAMILANSDASSEQVKSIISIIRKLIDKLLAAMNGFTDDIVSISDQKAKLYSGASEITTEMQG